MKKSLVLLALAALALGGCVAVPAQRTSVYRQPSSVVVTQPTPSVQVVTTEEGEPDYVGDDTPLLVTGYDVPFYPRYLVSCNCIETLAFIDGFWINHLGRRVVYDGVRHRPPAHLRSHLHNQYRQMIRGNPQVIRRAPPSYRPPPRPDNRPHVPAPGTRPPPVVTPPPVHQPRPPVVTPPPPKPPVVNPPVPRPPRPPVANPPPKPPVVNPPAPRPPPPPKPAPPAPKKPPCPDPTKPNCGIVK